MQPSETSELRPAKPGLQQASAEGRKLFQYLATLVGESRPRTTASARNLARGSTLGGPH